MPELVAQGLPELLPMIRTGDPESHVSAIIRSLCLRLGHFAEEDESSMTQEERASRTTRWELGSAFENAVAAGLVRRTAKSDPDRYQIIGELEDDGLIGTPDLVDLEEGSIIEIKLTWLSARHTVDSEKFWKYWVQLMAYIKMLAVSRIGYLHVAHVNGDYRNSGPIYNIWREEFTQQQLDENWRMLKSHAAVMARERSGRRRKR